MIAVTNNAGQLCNKLLLFANCLATGIETSQKVVHFCGYKIRQAAELDSEIGRRYGFMCLPFDRVRQVGTLFFELSKIYGKMKGVEPKSGAKTIEESRAFINAYSKVLDRSSLFAVHDWYFRNPDALFRQRDEITRYLSIKSAFRARPLDILANARRYCDKVVGVHLRRGDYKNYRDGVFYFSDEVYFKWMEEIAQESASEVCFLLCSNEPVNYRYFRERGIIVVEAPNHPLEDLVALSLCDYIIGPPSTYSWWAAFMGDVPLHHLKSNSETVALEFFAKPSPGSYP